MNKLKHFIKLQMITTYSLIVAAAVTAIFSLGFMSNFFVLFMDGNDEMYNFFKSIQELNNVIFNWSIIFLVLTLMYVPFELHKKSAGFFGLVFTFIVALINGIKNVSLFGLINQYKENYALIDFQSLQEYHISYAPFRLAEGLLGITLVLSVFLFVLCGINYFDQKKKGESHEN